MSNESQSSTFDFYLACMNNAEVQDLLHNTYSVPDVARALRSYAFQGPMYCNPGARHFLVALLDTIDWSLLAERWLACNEKRAYGLSDHGKAIACRSGA